MSAISKIMLIALGLLIAVGGRVCAQEADEYDVKVVYLWNFCSYVKWPEKTPAKQITVGFIGVAPTDGQIKDLDGRMTRDGTKKVVARRVTIADLKSPPEILFISGNDAAAKKDAQDAVKDLGNKPVLIVSEHGDTTIPSTIQFVRIDKEIKFSIDRADAAKRGLDLNAKLQRLAVLPPPPAVPAKPISTPPR